MDPKIKKLVVEAVRLRRDIEIKYIELGGILDQICNLSAGKSMVDSLAETLGMSRRKVYALMTCYRLVQAGKISRDDAIQIGWGKLIVVSKRLGFGNDAYWINMAKTKTSQQLELAVQGKSDNKRFVVRLMLTADEKHRLDAILIANGAVDTGVGVINREEAMMALLDKLPLIKRRARKETQYGVGVTG